MNKRSGGGAGAARGGADVHAAGAAEQGPHGRGHPGALAGEWISRLTTSCFSSMPHCSAHMQTHNFKHAHAVCCQTSPNIRRLHTVTTWSTCSDVPTLLACRTASCRCTSRTRGSTSPPSRRCGGRTCCTTTILHVDLAAAEQVGLLRLLETPRTDDCADDLPQHTVHVTVPATTLPDVPPNALLELRLHHITVFSTAFSPSSLQLPDLEVWFQRASDVVRKLVR